jgi:GDP-L-fucose synthase
MHFGEDRSILPAALIKKFYEYRNSSDNILLWGDGSPVREYTSAKDLARAMIWCVRNQDRNTLLNIGNTARISVKDLANTIALKMGIELSRLRFEGNAGTGRQLQSTNNTRFVAMSNFTYESIESAIDSAIQYFESEVLAK